MATQSLSVVLATALRVRRMGRVLTFGLLGALVLRLTGCGEPVTSLRPDLPEALGERGWWADDNPISR
jgi:hypothetical protein